MPSMVGVVGPALDAVAGIGSHQCLMWLTVAW
jgi:hypothetical protein